MNIGMRLIDRLRSNNKEKNLGFIAVTHTWIIIIILFVTLLHLLVTRMNIMVSKYQKIETINSNEMWNNFLIDQTPIFKNNNSNGIKLKLPQSNTPMLPSMNSSTNTNNNNHNQLEGNTETNAFSLSHLHEIKNNKHNNTKSKYDLDVSATPAAFHANNFGLSNSSINNIDLDLIVNDVILPPVRASLLPPVVNGGMLTSFVIFDQICHITIPINKSYTNKKRLLTMVGWSLLIPFENISIILLFQYVANKHNNNNPQNKIWKSVTNCNGCF